MRIIVQQGLGEVVSKATASNLLRIMERIGEVTTWHAMLTTRQQIDWAAPSTILKRCPIFNPPINPADKPMTKAAADRKALAEALEENERLKKRTERVAVRSERAGAVIVRVFEDNWSPRQTSPTQQGVGRSRTAQRTTTAAETSRTWTCRFPASGSRTRLTPSPTARHARARSGVRARSARRDAGVDNSPPLRRLTLRAEQLFPRDFCHAIGINVSGPVRLPKISVSPRGANAAPWPFLTGRRGAATPFGACCVRMGIRSSTLMRTS